MNTSYNYIVNPTVTVPAVFRNGVWTSTLPPVIYTRDLLRISIQGPPSSQAKCYQGMVSPENLFDTTQRGASNTADYSGGPVTIPTGGSANIVWSPMGGTFTGNEIVSATFTVRQQ